MASCPSLLFRSVIVGSHCYSLVEFLFCPTILPTLPGCVFEHGRPHGCVTVYYCAFAFYHLDGFGDGIAFHLLTSHLCIFLGKVCSSPFPVFNWVDIHLLCFELQEFFVHPGYDSLITCGVFKCIFFLHLYLNCFLCHTELPILVQSNLLTFSLIGCHSFLDDEFLSVRISKGRAEMAKPFTESSLQCLLRIARSAGWLCRV